MIPSQMPLQYPKFLTKRKFSWIHKPLIKALCAFHTRLLICGASLIAKTLEISLVKE
jgi:hypothetical protein